ncbi:MAG: hypothetical protein CM15mP59_5890 [Flavobacteriaceae bacterium]|nr:MAG: hypothetical protein CM15mP59_5890 [Flavobacteriaceae bacterium]
MILILSKVIKNKINLLIKRFYRENYLPLILAVKNFRKTLCIWKGEMSFFDVYMLVERPEKGVMCLDNSPNMAEPKRYEKEDSKKKIKTKSERMMNSNGTK